MSVSPAVPVIGLIGGIGSGKSAVAKWLASRRQVAVIDADAAGHHVLEQPAVIDAIRGEFGPTAIDENGRVDRRVVAGLVFGDGRESVQARQKLEKIVHPGIREVICETLESLRASNEVNRSVEAVLLDAAVLLEAGWKDVCDVVVFVDAPESQRRERVVRSRNWTAEDLQRRESSQLSLEEKRRRADFVVQNDSTLDQAGKQLEKILNQLLPSGV